MNKRQVLIYILIKIILVLPSIMDNIKHFPVYLIKFEGYWLVRHYYLVKTFKNVVWIV